MLAEESNHMDLIIIARSLTSMNDFRTFLDGSSRSSVNLRSAIVGHGIYQPGWKWSLHAGTQTGKTSENHIGYIVLGNMMIQDANGIESKVGPGDAFEVGPGHDAWVVGNEPCVAIDFYHRD